MSIRKATLSLVSSNLPSYLNIVEDMDFRLRGRIQLEDDRAPSWNTLGGELAVLDEEQQAISIQLDAVPNQTATTIRYGLLSLFDGTGGYLPFGLTLNSSTGLISGDIERVINPNIESVAFLEQDRPTWNTESQTWFHNEKEAVNISISASPNAGTEIIYSIREGNLPWGLRLSKTGSITGDTQETLFGDDDLFSQSPPRWNTPFGTIIESDEFENVSYQLDASLSQDNPTGTLSYRIKKGNLPWGLSLSPSGLISGQNTEVYVKDTVPPTVFPKPKWVTAFGLIKKIREKGTVDIQLEATPENGTTIEYRVIDGSLPWGLSVKSNGILSGTFDEIIYPELPDIVDENAPSVTTSSNIGTYSVSQAVSTSLSINLYSGRTLRTVYIEKGGNLPLGVTLNTNTGLISGTISTDAEIKTYTFTITAIDSADMRSSKVFNMTVA